MCCGLWGLFVWVGVGGSPFGVDGHGRMHGVEAVIDKDRAASLLARGLDADALLLLTDVAAVERDHGTPRAAPITEAPCRDREPRRGGGGAGGTQRHHGGAGAGRTPAMIRLRSRRAR